MEHGKHVLVEKPLALTLEDCDAVVAAADRTGMQLIVGHTHAFDPNIREMRRIIQSGELGRLGMILSFNYNDFLLRPHRADEFDPETGGGIAFNQLAHQIEIVRLLGGRVRSVRASIGALDSARARRPVIARRFWISRTVQRRRSSSAPTISSTATNGITGSRKAAPPRSRIVTARHAQAFLTRTSDLQAHQDLGYGGRVLPNEQPSSAALRGDRGDLRARRHAAVPDGILIHGLDGTREIAVPRGVGRPGQGDALDALWAAVREGRPCMHDARWGRATVEVILAILAIVEEPARGGVVALAPRSRCSAYRAR